MVIFLVNEPITLKNTSNSSYYAKKKKKKIEIQQSSSVLGRSEGELIGQHFRATYAAVQQSCIPGN